MTLARVAVVVHRAGRVRVHVGRHVSRRPRAQFFHRPGHVRRVGRVIISVRVRRRDVHHACLHPSGRGRRVVTRYSL